MYYISMNAMYKKMPREYDFRTFGQPATENGSVRRCRGNLIFIFRAVCQWKILNMLCTLEIAMGGASVRKRAGIELGEGFFLAVVNVY